MDEEIAKELKEAVQYFTMYPTELILAYALMKLAKALENNRRTDA